MGLIAGFFLKCVVKSLLRAFMLAQRVPAVRKIEHQVVVYAVLVLVVIFTGKATGQAATAAIGSVAAGAALQRLRDEADCTVKAL